MQKKLPLKPLVMIATCFAWLVTVSIADNPIVQTNFTADPAPMAYKDRVYLYTSHDDDVIEDDFYTMRNYRCYSTADMVNWTDHGMPASLKDFSWITVNNGAWAPQCVERDGKFYLYIPIQGKGMGVLVADSPTGPFKDPIGKALISRGNWSDIDPTVFVDSDGQAYHYWGNGTLWYVKLNENMTSYTGDIVTINPTPSSFTEGPWFYKRDSNYYMVYAGMDGGQENIQYAMSDGPTGPWTYKGVVMAKQGGSFTNHPGVCDFKEKSYLFYHNAALKNGGSYHRSVCVEEFTYKADGTIPSLSMSPEGVEQVGALNPYDTIQAETICKATGVRTASCDDGGLMVDSIHNGDNIKVKGVDFKDGAKSFVARVASGGSGGKIELHLDSPTGKLVGTCDVSGTGGWQTWTTKQCDVTDATEKHDLYLTFTGGNGILFNFNWWRFVPLINTHTRLDQGRSHEKIVQTHLTNGIENALALELNARDVGKQLQVRLLDLKGRAAGIAYKGPVTAIRQVFTLQNQAFTHRGVYLVEIRLDNTVTAMKKITW